jgi:hypothetical protein
MKSIEFNSEFNLIASLIQVGRVYCEFIASLIQVGSNNSNLNTSWQ